MGAQQPAQALAATGDPRQKLLVVGEFYEDRAPYDAMIRELGLAERVTVEDRYVPNEEVADWFAAADLDVVLVSRDKDLDQLVAEHVVLYDPTKDETLDTAAIEQAKGYAPEKAIEVQTLTGDSTDNIPGVPGIGKKTAPILIEEFGSLEALREHADELKSDRQKQLLKEYAEQALLSKRLATIEVNVPVQTDLEGHKVTDFDVIKSNLRTYRQYCDRAADLIGAAEEGTPGAARVLRRGLPIIDERIKEIIREIQEKARAVCIETRGTGTPYEPLGMEVNKWAGELSDRDYLQNERIASRIADILGEFCNLLPEDKREYPCKIVEELREESEPENKLIDIATALSYLEPCIESQLQNATKTMTDKTRSDEQPSQKTGHITTVFAESGSTVVVPQTETKSGDVTVNTAVTKESQPDKQPDRSSKRTAIEISADIAVHVLVYTVLHHFAEDLMPVIAPILVITALITLILIIRNANRDRSS